MSDNSCQTCHRPFLPSDCDAYRSAPVDIYKPVRRSIMTKLISFLTRASTKLPTLVRIPLTTLLGFVVLGAGLCLVAGALWVIFDGGSHLGLFIGRHLFGWDLASFMPDVCGQTHNLRCSIPSEIDERAYMAAWAFTLILLLAVFVLPWVAYTTGLQVWKGIKNRMFK